MGLCWELNFRRIFYDNTACRVWRYTLFSHNKTSIFKEFDAAGRIPLLIVIYSNSHE
jgi:hypothetical protein